MKKIIVFTSLLIIAITSFSQQTKSSPILHKQEYLLKSKHQKKAATVMLLGGVTSFLTMPLLWYITSKDQNGYNIFMYMFIAGTIAIPASIPLFIAAHRNKKKGMNLSFKNETAPKLQKSSFVYKSLPSLSLKINL